MGLVSSQRGGCVASRWRPARRRWGPTVQLLRLQPHAAAIRSNQQALKESLKEFIRRRKTQTVLPFAGITAMLYRARSGHARSPRERKTLADRGRAAFQQETASCDRVGHHRRRAEPETWPWTPEHIRTAFDRTGRGHRPFGSLTCAARWSRSPWKQRRVDSAPKRYRTAAIKVDWSVTPGR